ncbi:neuroplastin isoform X2 [Lingula anatina]|uniref:Neuroplastin isoform X2 n=1 Tax=Lingula anatina TaxID=7574 RepID=A0A1S3I3V4_LINAN|nr:neuroplastin isoform X2 [Lingula anatina]|eukprot:XP_013392945.1 neuroplastin isoform X2 [Lingula anatina]
MPNLYIATVLLAVLVAVPVQSVEVYVTSINPARGHRNILAGETIELDCQINVANERSLHWTLNGERLDAGAVGTLKIEQISGSSQNTRTTLKWENVTLAQSGTFLCQDQNQNQGRKDVNVVQITPREGELNSSLTTPQDITLRCEVEGLGAGQYQQLEWYFDDKRIDLQRVNADGPKYNISHINDSLVIFGATKEDVGTYECLVKTLGSKQENLTQKVQLLMDPMITDFSRSKNIVQGESVIVNCEIYGNPVDTVVWYKDDEPLVADGDRIKLMPHKNFENASLQMNKLDFPDRGVYKCFASNKGGESASKAILIRVKDRYAALWPFLGICAEVAILCTIIFIYEKRRAKKQEEEDQQPAKEPLTNDHKDTDVRQRNVRT